MVKGGVGCLLGLITLAAALIIALRSTTGMLREFEELGFSRVMQAQSFSLTNAVTEPTLFMAEHVILEAPCLTSIAIVARSARINSSVSGKLYFRGHTITVTENGILHDGLDAQAINIDNNGTIHGDITDTLK